MLARNIILILTFALGCLLVAQGILEFLAPQLIPFHAPNLAVASLLLGLVFVQICVAVWMNRRLHASQPNFRSFTWGYWNGLSCFVLTPVIITATAGPNALVVYEVMLIPIGVFVLLRHRWAFIPATVLSFNPAYYIANTIYIWKRWAEMGTPSQSLSTSAKASIGVPKQSRLRNDTWWKRLFAVLEIATATLGIAFVSMLVLPKINSYLSENRGPIDPSDIDFSQPPITEAQYHAIRDHEREERNRELWLYAIIILVPPVSIRLTRIAVTYIVEGKT